MEQALSKGTVIARYFLIPFWQRSIHVHVYRYMYQCTVSLPPPPPPPPGPASPLPRPIAFYVFVLVSPPNNATSTCMKIVWLLINNCSMNLKISRYNIAIFYSYRAQYRRYRLKTISLPQSEVIICVTAAEPVIADSSSLPIPPASTVCVPKHVASHNNVKLFQLENT